MNFNVAPPEAEHRSHPAVGRRARRLDEAARRGPPRRVQDLAALRFQIRSFALPPFRAFDFVCPFARSPFFGPLSRFPAGKRFFQ